MRNIELKARIASLEVAERVCRATDATFADHLRQVDTYFHCAKGRLKLREVDPGNDYLVHYHRPDIAETKACDYTIEYVDAGVKAILEAAYGIEVIVEKARDLWLWKNVRIHLDHVHDLGTFIEFEAVLSEDYDDEDGIAKLAYLQKEFGIESAQIIDVSYADLMRSNLDD